MKIFHCVIFCVFTGLLYLGVSLLGWGLDYLLGYFSIAARMGYAGLVGLFSAAIGFQAFGSIEGIRGRKSEADKFVFRQRLVREILVLSLYITLFFIPYFDRHAIGVSCVFQSWIGLITSQIFIATLIFQINDEEATMYKAFDIDWEVYCKRTWRLIPYIY
jgi:protein-S-isoprenylcysteine O-methyltransferase Ste14